MPRRGRYKDPFEGLTPEGRIELGAKYVVALTIMEGGNPDTLFDDANREDTITGILCQAHYETDDPELRDYALRIAANGLSEVFDHLHSAS